MMSGRLVECSVCGGLFKGYGYRLSQIETRSSSKQTCRKCRERELEAGLKEERNDNWFKAELRAHEFKNALEDCTKLGTCDIIRSHHKMLEDDPERLSSEFIIGLVCGNDGVEKYKSKRVKS